MLRNKNYSFFRTRNKNYLFLECHIMAIIFSEPLVLSTVPYGPYWTMLNIYAYIVNRFLRHVLRSTASPLFEWVIIELIQYVKILWTSFSNFFDKRPDTQFLKNREIDNFKSEIENFISGDIRDILYAPYPVYVTHYIALCFIGHTFYTVKVWIITEGAGP